MTSEDTFGTAREILESPEFYEPEELLFTFGLLGAVADFLVLFLVYKFFVCCGYTKNNIVNSIGFCCCGRFYLFACMDEVQRMAFENQLYRNENGSHPGRNYKMTDYSSTANIDSDDIV